MKRRIDMCCQCPYFDDTSQIVTWIDGTTSKHGRKKERWLGCSLRGDWMCKESFETLDVPDDCRMKAEYCMEEWNDEKKD